MFAGMVGWVGYVMKGPAELTGLAGTGAFIFATPLDFARFAHVLPQYGCTMGPSTYLGLPMQFMHIVNAEFASMFGFALKLAFIFRPPKVFELVGMPGRVLGAAHALEQKR
jgi:hypothetical protein